MYTRRGSFSLSGSHNDYSSYGSSRSSYSGGGGRRRMGPPPSLPPPMFDEDPSECYCRLSSIIKAVVFLLVLLGATGGLVYWFISYNSESKGTNSTTTLAPPSLRTLGQELEEKPRFIQKNFLDEEFLYSNIVDNELPADIRNQLRDVLQLFNGRSRDTTPIAVQEDSTHHTGDQEDSTHHTGDQEDSTHHTGDQDSDLAADKSSTESPRATSRSFDVTPERLVTSEERDVINALTTTYPDESSESDVAEEVVTTFIEPANIGVTPEFDDEDDNSGFTEKPREKPTIPSVETSLPTQTVYGFLNYTTTMANKVIIYTTEAPETESEERKAVEATRLPAFPSRFPRPETSTPRLQGFQTTTEGFLGLEKLFTNINTDRTSVRPSQRPTKPNIQPSRPSIRPSKPIRTFDKEAAVSSVLSSFPSLQSGQLDQQEDDLSGRVTTILSNFYTVAPGIFPTGLVTEKMRTLISAGRTTVYTTHVTGTYLGQSYAQILKTEENQFNEEKEDSSFSVGEVETVTDRPSLQLELETNEVDPTPTRNRESKSADDSDNSSAEREVANLSFKERLKQRFQKFRQSSESVFSKPRPSFVNARNEIETETKISSRSQDFSSSEERNRFGKRPSFIRNKIREVLKPSPIPETEKTEKRTFSPSRAGKDLQGVTESTREETTTRPSVQFKKFDRFNRPEARRNLLNKILAKTNSRRTGLKRPGSKEVLEEASKQSNEIPTEDEDEEDGEVGDDVVEEVAASTDPPEAEVEEQTKDESESKVALIDDDGEVEREGEDDDDDDDDDEGDVEDLEEENDNLEQSPEEEQYDGLLTTLDVTTVEGRSPETKLEIATIRSPYTFDVETGQSTRFITVTRTFTQSATSELVSTRQPKLQVFSEDTSTNPTRNIEDLETVPELQSSKEDTNTKPSAVQESVTKTPPLLTTTRDIETSQPSVQGTVSKPAENIVIQPTTSLSQIESTGFDSADRDLTLSPAILNQRPIVEETPSLQPTLSSFLEPKVDSQQNSIDPFNNIADLPLNFEQLEYLQKLKEALKPQLVVNSIPRVLTQTVYKTNTLKLIQDDKEFSTELLTPIGLTRVTRYDVVTSTLPPSLSNLPPIPDNLPPLQESIPATGLQPTTSVIVQPVELTTQVYQTNTQEYRIIFRNTPITTTLTNTRLVDTVVTSYSTVTQTLQPSVLPLAGFFG